MRDPNRIDEVLAAIGAAWKLDPDLRLGQLIMEAAMRKNLTLARDDPNRVPIAMRLFYIEDEVLVEEVKKQFGTVAERI